MPLFLFNAVKFYRGEQYLVPNQILERLTFELFDGRSQCVRHWYRLLIAIIEADDG